MAVSNVYNQAKLNAIAAIKQNISSQAVKKLADAKPVYLTNNGSIFNANGYKVNTTPQIFPTITDENIRQSILGINNKPNGNSIFAISPNPSNPTRSSFSNEEIENIDNASDGKAAAKQVNKQGDQVKKYTKEVEDHGDTVRDFSDDAKDLRSRISKDDKSFTSKLKQQQAQLKKDNDKLDKIIRENEETQLEVENAQHELDSLMATNSFSIGGENGTSSSNQERINELQVFIGSKVGLMQANGKMIYSLQRSSSRTLSKMKRTNAQYVKTQKKNTKDIKKQETTTDKIINVATKIEQYSALATQAGQTLDMSGQILVALGQAMSGTGLLTAVGAALISAGTIMSKVGTVVEMVGQYGQAAANITKTAAYAADGNLMGAMQSAAAAVQSGAAAVKSTTGLKNTFGEIDKRANEATQKLTADTVARQHVNEMTEEELGGLSKKEARKALSSNIQEQMSNSDNSLGQIAQNRNKNKYMNALKEELTKNGDSSIVSTSMTSTINEFQATITQAGGTIENGVITGLSNNEIKELKTKYKNGLNKTASKTTGKGYNWQDRLNQFSQGLQYSAALFNQYQNSNNTRNYNVPQWDLSSDPRFMKIARSNRAYQRHAAYI